MCIWPGSVAWLNSPDLDNSFTKKTGLQVNVLFISRKWNRTVRHVLGPGSMIVAQTQRQRDEKFAARTSGLTLERMSRIGERHFRHWIC